MTDFGVFKIVWKVLRHLVEASHVDSQGRAYGIHSAGKRPSGRWRNARQAPGAEGEASLGEDAGRAAGVGPQRGGPGRPRIRGP